MEFFLPKEFIILVWSADPGDPFARVGTEAKSTPPQHLSKPVDHPQTDSMFCFLWAGVHITAFLMFLLSSLPTFGCLGTLLNIMSLLGSQCPP